MARIPPHRIKATIRARKTLALGSVSGDGPKVLIHALLVDLPSMFFIELIGPAPRPKGYACLMPRLAAGPSFSSGIFAPPLAPSHQSSSMSSGWDRVLASSRSS